MKKRQGLTLIELLVTLAIMGLLLAVGTIGYRGSQKRHELRYAATELADVIERTKQYSLAPRKVATDTVCRYRYLVANNGSWYITEYTSKDGCTTISGNKIESGKLSDKSISMELSDNIADFTSAHDDFYTYTDGDRTAGASTVAHNRGAYTLTVKYAGNEQEIQINPPGSIEWL